MLRHEPPFGFSRVGNGIRLKLVKAWLRNATSPPVLNHGSCAVVGNSGILRLREDGREIDAHDAVIRVNHAPPPHQSIGKRLQRFSGNKTTWRVVTSRWLEEANRDPFARLLILCDQAWVSDCQRDVFVNGSHPLRHLVSPRFYAAVREYSGQSRIPLAGLVAVAVALRSCASVDVYGMSVLAAPKLQAEMDPSNNAPSASPRESPSMLHPLAARRNRSTRARGSAGLFHRTVDGVSKRICGYYYLCRGRHVHEGIRSDRSYHLGRPGDAVFHDFAAHARTLLAWNRSGVIRLRGALTYM